MQIGVATVESRMSYLKKLKIDLPFDPVSPSGNLPKSTQNTNLKEYKHPYIHCIVIYNLQIMEVAQVSMNRWVDETTMGHLYNGILCGHKK